jgi:GxxExxY protein
MRENEIGGAIIGAAIKIHSAVGPGLLESAYEACLRYELEKRELLACVQVPFLNFHVAHMRDGIIRMVNGL